MPTLAKILLLLAALAVAGAAAMLYYQSAPRSTPMETTYKTTTLSIGTTSVVAEVADTPELRSLGLSNRTSLEEGHGMWFVFEEDGLWPFWMRDTLIPLDMLWVSASGTIVTIAHNVQPESYPQAYAPASAARYVLELPGGFASRYGIAEGHNVVVE